MTDPASVAATPPASTRPPLEAAAARNMLDYDAFLRLLTTQLTNQDPTKPMDSTEYVAQLATFSEVEQSIQTNRALEGMLAANALAAADGLIGRTATAGEDGVSGVIEAIRVTREGAVATLESGDTLPLGDGVRIA